MRRRRKTLRVRLPELSPREATALSYLLNDLDNALWMAYGEEMTALCEREGIPLLTTDTELEQIADTKREP